jgi:antirestriction protein ArdC
MEQKDNSPRQIYAWVTQQIAASIAAGAPRFEMPWHSSASGFGLPVNVASNRTYRGINTVSLWVAAHVRGYTTPYWATYRQWAGVQAQVRKGERGTMIVFYKEVERAVPNSKDGEDVVEKSLIARASWVFNSDQVDNWLSPEEETEVLRVDPIEHADAFVRATRAEIHEGGDVACYQRHADYIMMPPRPAFTGSSFSTSTEAYYSTLLHELTHWSGHASRLNRDFSTRYGDDAYAMEELVAELGAAFLCAELSITNEPRLDHAAYVQSWLHALGNDARAIFFAASRANAAAEYLGSLQPR